MNSTCTHSSPQDDCVDCWKKQAQLWYDRWKGLQDSLGKIQKP